MPGTPASRFARLVFVALLLVAARLPAAPASDNAILYWNTEVLNATRLSRKTGWRFTALTAGSVGAWEPSYDPVAWARTRELHLLVQAVTQRDGNDREAAAVAPTPISVLVWQPPTP